MLKENKGRITYPTAEQAARLIEAATHDQNPHVYLFIEIGLETAMRKSEILSIRLEHIHLERKVIYVPKAKAGDREQPITSHLVEILQGYIKTASPG